MMQPIVLDRIPFSLHEDDLFRRLHVRPGRPEAGEARRLTAEALALARPKAFYRMAWVEERGEDNVVVDGVRLCSRVLSVNLAAAHRVFAYAATGGIEMEAWQSSQADVLLSFWADAIAELALRAAIAALDRHLESTYALTGLSRMNPGSLPDWPLTEQGPLFRILGDTERMIGLRLTDSFLMVPRKSVSGIQFPAEETFASCQLCPRTGCPNRRAPYDEGLFERKYRAAQGM